MANVLLIEYTLDFEREGFKWNTFGKGRVGGRIIRTGKWVRDNEEESYVIEYDRSG